MIKRMLLAATAMAVVGVMSTGSSLAATLMNIGYATAESNAYGTFMNTFADRLNKLTGGEIRVKVHCCFKMGGEQDMFKKLQLGTLDGTLIAQNNAGPFYPKIDLLVLPYMLQNLEHAFKVVDGDAGQRIWGAMPEEAGVHLVKIVLVSFRHIYNSKQSIDSIEDFRPLKYRVPKNVVMVDTYKAFGSDPVPMAWSETLTAVQTGTVDGGDLPLDVIYTQKFHEVAKHIALTGHFALAPPFFVSTKFMDKLTDEQKDALYMSADIAAAAARAHLRIGNEGFTQKLEAAGVQFTSPDTGPFIEAAAKVHEAFAAERGPEYVELVDAINAVAD